MNIQSILHQTKLYVQGLFTEFEGSHDFEHIKRVFQSAMRLAEIEHADQLIVGLAALLHDVADPKHNEGDEAKGLLKVASFLHSLQIPDHISDAVVFIIQHMSFKESFHFNQEKSVEFQVVQDADRLDAIGAIGIARAFAYGGYKKQAIYRTNEQAARFRNKQEYQQHQGSTINHFYEKLLLLKDQMNTNTAKRIAEERHAFMLAFLEQFYSELNWQE